MKTLYLVRHGIAESFSPSGQDSGRHLTPIGRSQVEAMGTALYSRGVAPAVILCSPYVRAVQTADILAHQLHYAAPIDQDKRLIPSASVQELQNLVTEFRSTESLMLVGHEPWVSAAMGAAISTAPCWVAFQPGSVCCIAVERSYPVGGSLQWFLPPSFFA